MKIRILAAPAAQAHPTYAQACSSCHGGSTAVKVAVTQTAHTATTGTYRVSVTGGTGSAGWAVLDGTLNRARASAATGTFTVPLGRTYRVWGVKLDNGASYVTLSAAAPAVVAPLTIRSSAASVLLGAPFVLSGTLNRGVVGDKVVVYVKRPGQTAWSYSSARLVYTAAGAWSYRYVPVLRGTYAFRAYFAGRTGLAAAWSPIVSVAVR